MTMCNVLMLALLGTLIGALIGWTVTQLVLAFFHKEIFAFMERIVDRVRRAYGLDE